MVGGFLKRAREEKGLTVRDIAERTNLMRQLVEELENEDFHRVAAAIYGRGFIKLYGEALELEPEKIALLQQDFSMLYSGAAQSPVKLKETSPVADKRQPAPEAAAPVQVKLRAAVVETPVSEDETPAPVAEAETEVPDRLIPEFRLVSEEPEPEKHEVAESAAAEREMEARQEPEEVGSPAETEEIVPELSEPVVEPEQAESIVEEDDLFACARRILEMRQSEAHQVEGEAEPESGTEIAEPDEGPGVFVKMGERIAAGAKTATAGAIEACKTFSGKLAPLRRFMPRGKTVLVCMLSVSMVVLLVVAIKALFAMTAKNGSYDDLSSSPPPPSFYID